MTEFVVVNGKGKLCDAAGKSERMIDRYLKNQSVPSAQTRYKLALACGCTHEEALQLAQEPPEAKGKAS